MNKETTFLVSFTVNGDKIEAKNLLMDILRGIKDDSVIEVDIIEDDSEFYTTDFVDVYDDLINLEDIDIEEL